jgi:polysaccharide pyruvyl transferase WcaK-like protein
MIYHIYANRSNIGDWLSAKGIQKLLAPVEIKECLCDIPFLDETMEQLSTASPQDLVVIGGGGLLMDYFIPFWEAFSTISDRVPFCIWGIGCCDLKQEQSLPPVKMIEDIVKKSRLCVVRDELTRTYLSGCDLPPYVPCPSINVIDPVVTKGSDLLHVANYTTAGAEIYDQMCETAKMYSQKHDISNRETNNRINKDREDEMKNILNVYQKSGLILSSALHGCIIGVAMGLQVIAVSGDRKIEGFMESVGLMDWVLNIDQVHKLDNLFDHINQQRLPYEVIESIRQQNQNVAKNIKDIYATI